MVAQLKTNEGHNNEMNFSFFISLLWFIYHFGHNHLIMIWAMSVSRYIVAYFYVLETAAEIL